MKEQLHKYFAGSLTDQEKLILFRELENNSALLEEFVQLQNTWAIAGMTSLESDDKWIAQKLNEIVYQSRIIHLRRVGFSFLKYAAMIALLISVWFMAGEHKTETTPLEYTYIEVPKGQKVSLVFPDGSHAWLSSRTKLKYSNRFNREERTVELDGEAFFTIEKNEQLPFIVSAKGYHVEVTGTKFNVFAYSNSELFETDLVEGSVFVYKNDNDKQKLQLFPNEKAYISNGEIRKSTSKFISSQDFSNGIYSFEDRSLQEIINWLAAWYNISFEIKNQEILSNTFSGKFRQSDSIEPIMRAIKETGKFNYRMLTQDRIEIY